MRIAQVAPLFESIPPKRYGGTERAVAVLSRELSYLGHEVTVFATADSIVHGELVPCRQTPLVAGAGDSTEAADHILQFDKVRERLDELDIVHFHTRFSHFPMFEDVAERTVTTCHNRVDFPELTRFYTRFRRFPLIALSQAQKRSRPGANWAGVIHHGYPLDYLPAYDRPEARDGYLAFLGRICGEKGVLDAIRIARKSGKQLRIAARINNLDREFWDCHVKKEIDGDQIQFVGEIGDAEKPEFLNCASALLFPIQWPEPFGLVMIEAMACGTPVIGYATGSVPEVIDHGQSGFVVADVQSAVQAVARLSELDRTAVRACFEKRFSALRMAEKHVALYESLVAPARRPGRMASRRVAPDIIPHPPKGKAGVLRAPEGIIAKPN